MLTRASMLGVLTWLHARRVGVALALVGGTLGLVAMAKGFTLRTLDARIFLLAAERFAQGEALYRESDGHLPFKYAPPVALVFLPFAALPQRLGLMAWGAVSALGFTHAAWRWTRLLAIDRVAPVLLATVALFGSFFLEADFGQSDLAMLWLLTEAFARSRRAETSFGAGLLFAAAAAFKPPALLFGLALALASPSLAKILAGALTGAALGLFAVFARYGLDGGLDEFVAWRALLATTTPPWFLGFNSQSLVPLVHLALGRGPPASMAEILPAQALATLPFALLAWPLRRRPEFLASALLVGAALLSPLAWRANFVLAWPVMLVLAEKLRPLTLLYLGALVSLQVVLLDGVLSEPARTALLGTHALGLLMAAGVGLSLAQTRWTSGAPASR